MDNASKNAGEMIDKLQMQFNRQRQAVITNELVDIIVRTGFPLLLGISGKADSQYCDRLVLLLFKQLSKAFVTSFGKDSLKSFRGGKNGYVKTCHIAEHSCAM